MCRKQRIQYPADPVSETHAVHIDVTDFFLVGIAFAKMTGDQIKLKIRQAVSNVPDLQFSSADQRLISYAKNEDAFLHTFVIQCCSSNCAIASGNSRVGAQPKSSRAFELSARVVLYSPGRSGVFTVAPAIKLAISLIL